jgi:hypothetical protein
MGNGKEISRWINCEHDGRLLLDDQEGQHRCHKLWKESKKEEILAILSGKM